jgi:hypothetical protein
MGALARVCRAVFVLTIALAPCAMAVTALGTVFVVDRGFGTSEGTIGAYTDSGATINASLITGLNEPLSVAVSGGFLYVTNSGNGTIGKYTTSGATVNASLVTGLSNPQDIEISGGNLFVSEAGNGRIGEYTTSGATVNASLITGLDYPIGLAISGTKLFVANTNRGTIGEYTTSGRTINPSLIHVLDGTYIVDLEVSKSNLFLSGSFVDDAIVGKYKLDGTVVDRELLITGDITTLGLAVSGTDLFVVGTDNEVGEYTTSGAVVNPFLITGLNFPFGIAVEGRASVPEAFSTLWLGFTAAGLFGFAQFAARKQHRH